MSSLVVTNQPLPDPQQTGLRQVKFESSAHAHVEDVHPGVGEAVLVHLGEHKLGTVEGGHAGG